MTEGARRWTGRIQMSGMDDGRAKKREGGGTEMESRMIFSIWCFTNEKG